MLSWRAKRSASSRDEPYRACSNLGAHDLGGPRRCGTPVGDFASLGRAATAYAGGGGLADSQSANGEAAGRCPRRPSCW